MLYCKLTYFEHCAEIAWFSSFEIRDLNQEQPLSFDSSGAFYCFSNGIYVSNYFNMRMCPSTNHKTANVVQAVESRVRPATQCQPSSDTAMLLNPSAHPPTFPLSDTFCSRRTHLPRTLAEVTLEDESFTVQICASSTPN